MVMLVDPLSPWVKLPIWQELWPFSVTEQGIQVSSSDLRVVQSKVIQANSTSFNLCYPTFFVCQTSEIYGETTTRHDDAGPAPSVSRRPIP